MAKKDKGKRPSVMGREKFREKQKEAESKRRGSNPIQLPEGVEWLPIKKAETRRLHLVPYRVTDPKHPLADVGDIYYFRPFSQHRNVGPDDARIICPRTWGGLCPICAERSRLKDEGASKDDETVRALNASDRGLYLFQDADEDDGKLYAYEAGMFGKGGTDGFGMMLKKEIDYQDEEATVPWDWDGPSLVVRFAEGKFRGNKYFFPEKLDLEDLGKDLDPAVLDMFPSRDDWLVRMDAKAVDHLFMGVEGEGEDEPREERKPPKEKAVTRPSPRKEEPPPEEEEEDEDGPPEFESPSAARRALADWDPDDVDFDDEDAVASARLYLVTAAEAAGGSPDELPAAMTGKTNNTERGLKKLRDKLVEGLPPEEKPKPAAGKKGGGKADKGGKKNECPHGYTFGSADDWLEHDECGKCEVEDACGEKAG